MEQTATQRRFTKKDYDTAKQICKAALRARMNKCGRTEWNMADRIFYCRLFDRLMRSIGAAPVSECSVCRRPHGLEIQHPCE